MRLQKMQCSGTRRSIQVPPTVLSNPSATLAWKKHAASAIIKRFEVLVDGSAAGHRKQDRHLHRADKRRR
ncbi:hypothetical protein OG985_45955 [Streptomyces sp. NBC_00289]|uniref:hypothetical protein n=1 Tax=Streptomyces sp. NBC_00289 TaxID=2975703 RepID=UPI00324F8D72